MTEQADRIVQRLVEIGQSHDMTPSQVATAWVLDRPEITSVIIGPDAPEHVDEAVCALGWQLSVNERAALDDLSKIEMPSKFA